MAEHMLAVSASSAACLRLQLPDNVGSIAVAALSEMSLQRWVVTDPLSQSLLVDYLKTNPVQAETWFVFWNDEGVDEPLELPPFYQAHRGHPCLYSSLGDLPGLMDRDRFPIDEHRPVGFSDSERAFAILLERLRKTWIESRPDRDARLALIADYAGRMRRLNDFSFQFWDGELLFAYSDGSQERGLFQEYATTNCYQGNGVLPFTVESEQGADIAVIASAGMLTANANPVIDGQLLCCSSGQLWESCDPVSFWSDLTE